MRNEVNQFLRYLAGKNYASGTVDQYQRILGALDIWSEDKDPRDLKLADLVHYREHLAERMLAPSTRNQHIAAIKSFFNWYYEMNDLPFRANPSRRLELVRAEERVPQFLTPEQIAKMKENARNLMEYVIVEVLYITGVRASELINANVSSFSYSRRELRVMGKGSKERIVPLTEYCCHVMQNYLENRDSTDPALFVAKNTGKRLNYNQLYYIIRKLGDGVVHPHLLRHTTATMLLEGGVTMKEVQSILGHSTIQSTARYTHVTQDIKRKHEEVMGHEVPELEGEDGGSQE